MLLIASDAVDGAADTKARLDELNKQRDAAANALAKQLQRAATAQTDFDAWSVAWCAAAVRVGLPETIDVASAEGALAVMAEIDAKLRSIHEIRTARSETMQHDLSDFQREVGVLVSAVAAELAPQSPAAAVTELMARLAKALDDKT